ncbi:MAG: hypothetical protein WDO13_04590 [Verrucomicrobiota bacterium]
MSYGRGYDSDEGRGLAGAITALMTGTAYEVSAELAEATGPFPGYHDARCNGVDKPLKPGQCRADAGSHRAPPEGLRRHRFHRAGAAARRGRHRVGKPRWSAAAGTATATPRSPSWRPPAPSASSWTATPPASSPTSRW